MAVNHCYIKTCTICKRSHFVRSGKIFLGAFFFPWGRNWRGPGGIKFEIVKNIYPCIRPNCSKGNMDSYTLFKTATLDRRDILQSLGIVSECCDRSCYPTSGWQKLGSSECHDISSYPTFWVPWWITLPNFLRAVIDHITQLQGDRTDHATQLLSAMIDHITQLQKSGNMIYDGTQKVG